VRRRRVAIDATRLATPGRACSGGAGSRTGTIGIAALRDEDTDQASDEVGRNRETDDGLDEPDSGRACGNVRAGNDPFARRRRRRCFDTRGQTHRAFGSFEQPGAQYAPHRSQSRGWALPFDCGSELQDLQHGDHLWFSASPESRVATRS
jgi:hypothetical protein